MATIYAKEYPIKEVFSNRHAFWIPPYQRPYSWGPEHSSALLNDLLAAANGFSPDNLKSSPTPYFLGSIVLVKEENLPDAEVIDGQQRLTTLALLLSALRVTFADTRRQKTFGELLFEEGDKLVGTQDRCRLVLRDRDHGFFEQNILRHETLDLLNDIVKTSSWSEPQKRLARNCKLLLDQLRKLTLEKRESLAAYLLQHTFLVVVATPSFDSAFRIFSVLNDRGLDLTVADILKAEIIGQIPQNEQALYNERWDDAEEQLGTQNFAALFSHIRMIHARAKLRKTVLEEFRAAVKASTKPKQFIDGELLPSAEVFDEILSANFQSDDGASNKKINFVLSLLHRVGDRDWVPSAILFLRKHRSHPERVLFFLNDLERLAAGLWLLRWDENQRIERYCRLLAAIETEENLSDIEGPLQLSPQEKKEIVGVIDGNIYELTPKSKRTMVLLRLDGALSSGEASYQLDRITVEHVLPQNPPAAASDGYESKWVVWWPDVEQRTKSVHRLGNLALLNRRQNSAAKNWEFAVKKEKYFKTKGGASPFVITSEVLKQSDRTPSTFEDRQQRFLNKLKEVWRLG
jgi:hypothetical protein